MAGPQFLFEGYASGGAGESVEDLRFFGVFLTHEADLGDVAG